MNQFVSVILAGGSGERFWPLSRKHKPKQFLSLDHTGSTLLQATAERLLAIHPNTDNLYVITSAEYRGLVLEQLPELPVENLIVEPFARDTAPAVLYATLCLQKRYDNPIIGFFPADHRVTSDERFERCMLRAADAAERHGSLVVLGIEPNFPATGYGYIRRGESVPGRGVYHVSHFAEKPDVETAQAYLDTGVYCWNSGMLVASMNTLLEEFRTHQNELLTVLSAAKNRLSTREAYASTEKISFDYAILEKSKRVHVVPGDFDWDDLGDWNALERLLKNNHGAPSSGRHVGLDTEGVLLYNTNSNELIVTIGLEDVTIVSDKEVTLVVRKERTQDIKKVVQQLKNTPGLERFA
ncbi:mannose-1-phosphate guanylyltransferase [Deinococcus peraridilitoris]|uniref:mannose-1-phosphate guanylyltransferase n=1 Tax=Deinococcus peraridilitoris (strain DSM 19664 / LMG 22246 / CIP 109416 / KR-200) TaxID=937777 RepID=L0A5G6_DEIPD|nr:mannose-1-phosphate guanylyltransferase [Deinococcus peraridilitoris]AFZ68265.1 mannose-1-phosphate guanylyltransferase [Deinococcus peraridilitoris DSM 19664]